MEQRWLQLGLLCLAAAGAAHAHGGVDDGDTPEGAPPPDLRSGSLIAVKMWCLLIVFLSTFLAGISPYFLRWNEGFLILGTQFAGGVFLGTALIHFLGDAATTFTALIPSTTYPIAYMLACAGFLVTMLADCIIVAVSKRSRSRLQAAADKDEHAEEGRPAAAAAPGSAEPLRSAGEFEDMAHHLEFVRTTSFEDTLLLIVALCFHSVFEGIAIGLAGSESDAWTNLWTIGLHKTFAAVAMGIALLRLVPKRPLLLTVGYSFLFAISTPVGIGIGIGINATTQGPAASWTYAVAMGFAAGIFIYVAINHLIAKGFKPEHPHRFDTPFFRFFAVVAGVAVIAVVLIWD